MRHGPRAPSTPIEWLLAGGLLLLVFGLFAVELLRDFQPVKLGAVLIVAFWVPLLVWHEAGHALAASCLGWRVERVVIGFGKPLFRFRCGGAAVEVRLLPIEGFVACVPRQSHWPRLQSARIYFAGPGIELVLAGGILAVVGPQELFRLSDNYAHIAGQSLAAAATAQAVLNLLPAVIVTPQGKLMNDGMGILYSLFGPRPVQGPARSDRPDEE